MDATAIIVALIAAIASIIGGIFAYMASRRVKTPNGLTAGQLADDISTRLGRMETWFVTHMRDHEQAVLDRRADRLEHAAERASDLRRNP